MSPFLSGVTKHVFCRVKYFRRLQWHPYVQNVFCEGLSHTISLGRVPSWCTKGNSRTHANRRSRFHRKKVPKAYTGLLDNNTRWVGRMYSSCTTNQPSGLWHSCFCPVCHTWRKACRCCGRSRLVTRCYWRNRQWTMDIVVMVIRGRMCCSGSLWWRDSSLARSLSELDYLQKKRTENAVTQT